MINFGKNEANCKGKNYNFAVLWMLESSPVNCL